MQSISAYRPPPATVGSSAPAPGRTAQGVSVSLLPTVTSFFSSLSPEYCPHNERQLYYYVAPAVAGTADKSQLAGDMIQRVKLACAVLSSWVPTVTVVSDAVATLCSSLSVVQDLGAALADKDSGKSAAGTVAAFTLVALDNLASAGAVRPAPGKRGSPEKPITVPDSKTLSMIGQDGYPADAFYRQTGSFSHRSTEPGPSFKGYYDGGCHTISDLQSCLFGDLDRYADVRNLRLSRVTIEGDRPTMAALACTMKSFARARDIHVENATIVNHESGNYHQSAATGVVTGHQHRAAQLEDISLNNCLVNTTGEHSVAGGVAAIADGLLRRANIANSQVITHGSESYAGLGAGSVRGQMEDLALIDSQVFTHGRRSDAGGTAGVVVGNISQVGATRCNVSTTGEAAAGGIGAGFTLGHVSQLSGVECQVITMGPDSPAGVGAGHVGFITDEGHLHDLVAIDSDVIATGERSVAGVGAGVIYTHADQITSVRCRVTANSMAGVGTGMNLGKLDGLNSVNSTVRSQTSSAYIGAGNNNDGVTSLVSWNSRSNRELRNNTGAVEPQNPCQSADPRFIQPNCIATPSPGLQQTCQGTYAFPKRGTALRPIVVDSAQTLNRIGLDSNYPASAHYIQTREIDGSMLNSDDSVVFSGHYDGQDNVIRDQTACLFKNLFGTVRNLHLVDARINSNQPAAVVACEMDGAGGIESILIDHCHVATRSAPAGIICGRQKSSHNKVKLIDMYGSAVHSDGNGAVAGTVAGQCRGQIEQVTIRSSQVSTRGEASHAGLGCGEIEGLLRNFSTTCSQVETTGPLAWSGIGVGKAYGSKLGPGTIVSCNLTASGQGADAGMAAGLTVWQTEVNNFTMLDSRVRAREANAAAGVGVMGALTTTNGVTAVRCEVVADAHAGIGVGLSRGLNTLSDIVAVNCSLSAPVARVAGSYSDGRPVNATGTRIANTRINGLLHNTAGKINGTSCAGADRNLVNPGCHVNQRVFSPGCSVPPLAIIATPTPLPVATGLSAAAVAGITMGTVLILGTALAGYCCYRRHHQSSDRASFHRFEGEYGYDDGSFSDDSF